MPASDWPVVTCRGLTRHFGQPRAPTVALSGVDLALHGRCFTALTGPSGCGKSTLLSLVGLLDNPTSGTLHIDDLAIGAGTPRARARFRQTRIGFLFQDAGLIAAMTALDNVMLPLRYAGVGRAEARRRAVQELARLEVDHLAGRRAEQLSGGERQRVAFARAMVKRPDLLVCDEPTASLDEHNSRLVAGALCAYANGGALVLCATHDPLVIERADRRIAMAHGRIAAA